MRLVKAAVCNSTMIKCISKVHICMDYKFNQGTCNTSMMVSQRRWGRIGGGACVRVWARRRARGGEMGEGSAAFSRGEWCRLRAKRAMRTH